MRIRYSEEIGWYCATEGGCPIEDDEDETRDHPGSAGTSGADESTREDPTMNTVTETIPAFGCGESVSITLRPSDRPRIAALLGFITYGEHYRRGVWTALNTYSLFTSRSEPDAAARFLAEAEQIAQIMVGAEEYRHVAGTCRWDFVLPGRAAPVHCGDPRCI
jgi:hypothetical protein